MSDQNDTLELFLCEKFDAGSRPMRRPEHRFEEFMLRLPKSVLFPEFKKAVIKYYKKRGYKIREYPRSIDTGNLHLNLFKAKKEDYELEITISYSKSLSAAGIIVTKEPV